MDIKKRKIVVLVIIGLIVVLSIFAGTYAYWTWTSSLNKNVIFNTASGISEDNIVYNEGESLFIGNFQPTSAFCDSTSTTLSFYKTSQLSSVDVIADIYMDVNAIGDNIASSENVYWVVTRGDNSVACVNGLFSSQVIGYGNFNGVVSGNTITLASNIEVTTSSQQFTVWIWIDSSGNNLSNLSGDTLDTNVWTEISTPVLVNPNAPVLGDGMIPVTISTDGTVTTVYESDDSWYDYENKMWANAILVNTTSRGKYKNTSGVTVSSSDILAYYVWIPRYKYKIMAPIGVSGNETSVDILFENNNALISTSSYVGNYITHPAFWYDINDDGVATIGEMLDGIWVGKFETTGTSNTPTILPNVSALTNQTVLTQFTTSLKFAGGTLSSGNVSFSGNNTYGLSSLVDSHMMKNSEWGAVAYLAHSVYGINGNVSSNTASVTGGGTSSYGAGSTYSQSTTGNISGVFDMSGGKAENVMANYKGISGSSNASISFPPSRFYDVYNDEYDKYNGHALSETEAWYSSYALYASASNPWFSRGYYNNSGEDYGMFNFSSHSGASGNYAWRSVLVIK